MLLSATVTHYTCYIAMQISMPLLLRSRHHAITDASIVDFAAAAADAAYAFCRHTTLRHARRLC